MSHAKLMSVAEFAESLGVTSACIRRWISERKIASVKLGRLVKIPDTETERLINLGLRSAKRGLVESGTVPTLERRR